MPGLKTSYEFTLPRGYVDPYGGVHRTGRMRLATARDELEPLRDPQITGPDDPRLTILVLARVVEKLGDLGWVSVETIESLFAVDLAFLQDFYGVINFGTPEEFEALIAAQQDQSLVGTDEPEPEAEDEAAPDATIGPEVATTELLTDDIDADVAEFGVRPSGRTSVEELPRLAR